MKRLKSFFPPPPQMNKSNKPCCNYFLNERTHIFTELVEEDENRHLFLPHNFYSCTFFLDNKIMQEREFIEIDSWATEKMQDTKK